MNNPRGLMQQHAEDLLPDKPHLAETVPPPTFLSVA
jgi:hypothetical protein